MAGPTADGPIDDGPIDDGPIDDGPLPAGAFGAWLDQLEAALAGRADADVPCGTCTACCTSSQFVHVAPDEVDTLAHIPPDLRFPAPMLPKGHVLLPYDERGHCPMLVDGRCSIYAHRPRACRAYDCRVFAAVDLDPAEDGRPAVAARVRRWRFDHPTAEDAARHGAVRAAAAYLADHPEVFPDGSVPAQVTGRALAAVDAHPAFLDADGSPLEAPAPEAVAVALRRRT